MIAKASFFYRLFKQRPDSEPPVFIGTAFAVAPDGGLLTCRHVVDQQLEPEESIAVFDEQLRRFTTVESVSYPPSSTVDAAFLPEALRRKKDECLPLLRPDLLKVGEEVYAFGYF